MNRLSSMIDKPVLVIGAGGHTKVLVDALLLQKVNIVGILDCQSDQTGKKILGIPIIGNDGVISAYHPTEVLLVNGIGSIGKTLLRQSVFVKFKKNNYRFATVVHPGAILARDVLLQEGAQVMAGAIIQTGCSIGGNSIVNTGAKLDHDCKIGVHVHLSPGSTLCGGCIVEDGVHIGAGATVVQGLRIGRESIIGAGAVVLKDIAAGKIAFGVPAREVIEWKNGRNAK